MSSLSLHVASINNNINGWQPAAVRLSLRTSLPPSRLLTLHRLQIRIRPQSPTVILARDLLPHVDFSHRCRLLQSRLTTSRHPHTDPSPPLSLLSTPRFVDPISTSPSSPFNTTDAVFFLDEHHHLTFPFLSFFYSNRSRSATTITKDVASPLDCTPSAVISPSTLRPIYAASNRPTAHRRSRPFSHKYTDKNSNNNTAAPHRGQPPSSRPQLTSPTLLMPQLAHHQHTLSLYFSPSLVISRSLSLSSSLSEPTATCHRRRLWSRPQPPSRVSSLP